MSSNQRIVWMDISRTIAIIFVVICHVIETQYYSVRMGKLVVSDELWLFENILFTFGRLGVPLFLMLTGALMLNREYDIKQFYKKSLIPLFLTTEIWTIINYFYYCIQYSTEFSIKNLIGNMVFVKTSPLNHMWYMPMILGIYLVIPFVAKALKNVRFLDVALPLLIAFVAFSIVPMFNALAGEVVSFFPDANLTINVAFLGGLYGMLMISGHYIGKENLLRRIPTTMLILAFIIAFGCNTIGARYFYSRELYHSDVFGWYTSPFIIISAICLFELIKRFPAKECPKTISLISKGSFAIYLTHNLVLISFNALIQKYEIFNDLNFVVLSIIRFIVSFGIPLLIIAIANKLPFKEMKKLILYMK